ncbi:GTP 3',8-cyclase MoaA [candidate division KSB3 bacterium]|uniref:GTP 3',8-cyclase n=1 Tax=candidate division KSB3 bacterium TaxID=2044937 RepID=A0A9D5Q4L9_9BACT|nr:GTP 3',8-cyclase MoaA [candidate division KSB3 bacterium]MBD3323056.1 GTP 3',8-cyclase MoaA [candidate division KSB3 bacterium]
MLQDSRGRQIVSLRISVTDRCNLRCRYCMPPEGVTFIEHEQILRYEEIERLVQVALRLGVRKVRLTGGEPLVRKGVVDFASRLSRLKELEKLSLTTNGMLLARYAPALKAAGIQYLNISLDTLQPEKFHRITRFDGLEAVLQGIHVAQKAGFSLLKLNVVAVRGTNDDELLDFVNFATTHDVVIRFIEYMPFCGNAWQREGFISAQELQSRIEEHYTLIPFVEDPASPAKTYRIAGHPGQVGFIASVSESFCHLCNRLRVTADGHLRPCLHGQIEVDVKGPLRRGVGDDELADLFREAVARKPFSHQDFLNTHYDTPLCDREMVRIGG